ncbi:sensor histidine kinase [Pseudonocardia sp. CA-107938]|uniref:sensor histidine kinase n=1 Tax=Pseudonocardia sp. CA-107938 TaxID=3240021 RepID=UPI003D8A2BD2
MSRYLSPRLVVLAVLASSFAWVLVFPVRLTRPPTPALTVVYGAGLVLFVAAQAVVLRAAVSLDQPRRTRLRAISGLVVVALALWWPAFAWAEPDRTPWAWLAGFAAGAAVLAHPAAGAGTAIGLAAAAAVGAAVFGGSLPVNVAVVLGIAVALWLAGLVLVWLLRLLAEAEAGRAAEADLAIAQERLRVSRELHDVLGHRLGIIALKAELAGDLVTSDPARAAAENEQIRELAATTLAEARRAVHGETVADLATQLASAELVLGSAGIDTAVDVDASALPVGTSRLLAAVVREAVTNVLRHSAAQTVSITYAHPTLRIVNDGAQGDPTMSGTGLASLAARCAAAGARLVAGPVDGGRFEVRVELAP